MKLLRRRFLHLAAGAAALPAVPRIARAQAYPTRPARIIVGFAAGGPTDIVARMMVQWLSERLGQQFIVENRPGAGSNIAAEAAVRAPPDGYTLFEITISNAVNATVYSNLNFNLIRDFTPVAGNVRTPGVMEVNPSVPTKTVSEFIAYAKAHPGKINLATAGTGSAADIYGAMFRMMTGVELATVAYRGSAPSLIDLIGGQVQVTFDPLSGSIEHIRGGKLRALGVTTATRVESLPDIPTIGDTVPGYAASSWNGIVAPKNTPVEIVDRLNREVNAAFADPKIRARLADFGGLPLPGSPADFGKFIADETDKWAKVVRYAGMKPE
jgi:tripartite-type tricarboxylate transporter receptor subunit TctC